MGNKLELDYETADKITLDNLTVCLPAFKLLIEYYGGTV
jgi:hypothetical protein